MPLPLPPFRLSSAPLSDEVLESDVSFSPFAPPVLLERFFFSGFLRGDISDWNCRLRAFWLLSFTFSLLTVEDGK